MKTLMAAQLLVETSAEQYVFRHALTQQAVYQGLVAHTRKALHYTVARAMEHRYASNLQAHNADLAYHFYQAQAWPQALLYAQRLGEQALSVYASHAAVEHLTHALEAANHLPEVNLSLLYRVRGGAYRLLSNFEAARSDYEQASEAARVAQDQQGEWQSLIALGYTWTDRDYTPAGDYFQRALALAQALADPRVSAISRNHLADWLVNVGQPASALAMLQESLEVFQRQGDMQNVALTLQFLGSGIALWSEAAVTLRP